MSDAVDRGLTVTELAPVGQPIDLAPETTAAFAGRTLRGPLNEPVLIRSFADFRHRFGGIWTQSSLGPAVEQFFEHGGRRAYVVRLANEARGALLCLPASGSALVLRAIEPGSTERVRAAVDYDGIPRGDDDRFNLTLQRIDPESGLVSDQELYRGASIRAESSDYIVDALLTSSIVRTETPLPTHRPDATGDVDAVNALPYVVHAQDGRDGTSLSDYDIVGSRKQETGLFALEAVPHFDILYVPPPGRGLDLGPAAVLAADRYCRERGAMLIVDPLMNWKTPLAAIDGIRELGYSSPNMLAYFPRMRHRGRSDEPPRAVGGAIAGMLCKLDRRFGPWRRPDEVGLGFRRSYEPAAELDDEQARLLMRAGINGIRAGRAGTARFAGSVTLARGRETQREFASLPVRRLILGMIATIDRATRPAVFEPAGERLGHGLELEIGAYLGALADLGALGGRPRVACDVKPSHQAATGANEITIHMVVAPVPGLEPLSITLHQGVAGCRAATTAFGPGNL